MDSKYSQYFNKATEFVPLLKLLYILNIPLAKLCLILNLKPMTITHLSNLTFIISLYYLYIDRPWIFFTLQFLALGFDICDGIVARMNKLSSVHGSFYDHFSDKIKVSLVLSVLIFKHLDNSVIVGVSLLEILLFFLLCIVNSLYIERTLRIQLHGIDKSTCGQASNILPRKKEHTLIGRLLRWIYRSIFIMYGNFMVPFFLLGFDKLFSFSLFVIVIVTLNSLIQSTRSLICLHNEMQLKNITWK